MHSLATFYTAESQANEVTSTSTVDTSMWSIFDQSTSASPSSSRQEFVIYNSTGPNSNRNLDVLNWWKSHEAEFPLLAGLARSVLAISVSNIPSESTFSCSRHLINFHRTQLGVETVERLICHSNWLKAKIPLSKSS